MPEQVHARGEHRHAAFLFLLKVAEQVEHAGPVPDPRGDAGEVPRGQAGGGDEAPQRSRGRGGDPVGRGGACRAVFDPVPDGGGKTFVRGRHEPCRVDGLDGEGEWAQRVTGHDRDMQQLALPEHGPEAEVLQIAEVHHAAHVSRRHPVFPDAFDGVLQLQGFLFGDAEAFPVEIGLRLQPLPHGVGRDGVDGAGGRPVVRREVGGTALDERTLLRGVLRGGDAGHAVAGHAAPERPGVPGRAGHRAGGAHGGSHPRLGLSRGRGAGKLAGGAYRPHRMTTPCTRTGPREAPPSVSTMSEKNAISRLISPRS